MTQSMINLIIDGVAVEVADGTTILQACEMVGVEIPRFCYHERLSVAGNCRMCLVDVEGASKPIAGCAQAVAEGMVVDTRAQKVKTAREGVMEFLLVNHPLDCPICDQGGECDLQDQALGYGYDTSRFDDNKRAVEDKDMGPLVKTIMTRCIHCTRCVRFAAEVAGVPEIGAIGRGEDMEITTYLEASLSSELSGNVIDLCPVGALTSKPYAFTARPWELTKTETIDVMDAMGAHIRVDARGHEIMRILPRNHDDINEEWLSDKARFVWDGLNAQRLDRPYMRAGKRLIPCDWNRALDAAAGRLKEPRIAALAGDLACTESQYALAQLMSALGSPHLDCRQDGAYLPYATRGDYLFNSTIAGIDAADALLIIGANPRLEAPVLNARIGQRVRAGQLSVGFIGEEVDLSYAVTHLGESAHCVGALLTSSKKAMAGFAKRLRGAKRPMLMLGMGALARRDGAAIYATARSIAESTNMLREDWNGFNILHTAAARVGGLDVGFVPGDSGMDTRAILAAARQGKLDALILLGADEVDMDALKNVFTIYIGTHGDRAAQIADIVLPAATYTEKQAIYVNLEGRAQMTERAVFPPNEAREDWKILRALSERVGATLPFDTVEALRAQMFETAPQLAQLDEIVPAELSAPTKPKAIQDTKLTSVIGDFYLTNAIARASKNMADCSAARAERERKNDR